MARTEQQLIDICIRQIEEKFTFGRGNGSLQRDLEMLSAYMESKSGTVISISTLKRLWKRNHKQSPQLATLNALAAALDFADWHSFKQANQQKLQPTRRLYLTWGAVAVMLAGMALFLARTSFFEVGGESNEERSVKITGPIQFEASKTITTGIPNTVIFKYDVSNVIADSIFIQQSWNRDQRMALDRQGSAVTRIYYESGFHRARLMANDSVIAMQPVHIISDGWEPHLYYSNAEPPIDLKGEDFISDGRLHIERSSLERRGMDFNKGFYSRITFSNVFDVHSDNFSFTTRFKVDSLFDELCPWVNLLIVTEVNVFSVALREKGCENRVSYDLGEISKHGRDNDLSALGCHVHEWQELEIRSSGRRAGIYLNGKLTYEETYQQDFGKVVGFIYIFGGTGSIDYARLADARGEFVFEDDFEE